MCYEIKVMFGEIFPKLCQMNWNIARNNVDVVVDELSSQITIYTCLKFDIWTWHRQRTSTWFGVICQKWRASTEMVPKYFDFIMTPLAHREALSESYATYIVSR